MNKLRALSDRLKAYQHKLIDQAAASDLVPSDSVIAKISAIENAIVAVETLISERSEGRS